VTPVARRAADDQADGIGARTPTPVARTNLRQLYDKDPGVQGGGQAGVLARPSLPERVMGRLGGLGDQLCGTAARLRKNITTNIKTGTRTPSRSCLDAPTCALGPALGDRLAPLPVGAATSCRGATKGATEVDAEELATAYQPAGRDFPSARPTAS
jgi:hypothetical protein